MDGATEAGLIPILGIDVLEPRSGRSPHISPRISPYLAARSLETEIRLPTSTREDSHSQPCPACVRCLRRPSRSRGVLTRCSEYTARGRTPAPTSADS